VGEWEGRRKKEEAHFNGLLPDYFVNVHKPQAESSSRLKADYSRYMEVWRYKRFFRFGAARK
jgi:hypothetical protein